MITESFCLPEYIVETSFNETSWEVLSLKIIVIFSKGSYLPSLLI